MKPIQIIILCVASIGVGFGLGVQYQTLKEPPTRSTTYSIPTYGVLDFKMDDKVLTTENAKKALGYSVVGRIIGIGSTDGYGNRVVTVEEENGKRHRLSTFWLKKKEGRKENEKISYHSSFAFVIY